MEENSEVEVSVQSKIIQQANMNTKNVKIPNVIWHPRKRQKDDTAIDNAIRCMKTLRQHNKMG